MIFINKIRCKNNQQQQEYKQQSTQKLLSLQHFVLINIMMKAKITRAPITIKTIAQTGNTFLILISM